MRWKKIAGGIAVVLVLAFAFWYGGNTPDSRGFGSDETTVVEQQDSPEQVKSAGDRKQQNVRQTEKDDGRSQKADASDRSGSFFQQLVMKITHKGSYASSKKGQGSKKAQRNAAKAVKKAERERTSSKNSAAKNSKKKKTVAGNTTATESAATTTAKEDTSSAAKNDKTETTQANETHSDQNDKKNDSKENTKTTETTQQEATTTEATTEVPENMVRCTISISCNTLLDHMDLLKENKKKLVPKDGSLLGATSVDVKKGSTVFDVLQKVTKENKIQLEYNYTPAYKNYYIEGIGNLYEFDGGELSGWMYSVNGEFPGYGCSSYVVKDGDEIRWLYTCSLGKDVGGYFEE